MTTEAAPSPDRCEDLDEQGIANLRKVFPAAIARIEREAYQVERDRIRAAMPTSGQWRLKEFFDALDSAGPAQGEPE